MNRYFLAALGSLLFFNLNAQHQFEWIEPHPVNWNLNPAFTEHLVTTDGLNRSVTARMVAYTLNYTGLFGHYGIEARDSLGNIQTSFSLSPKVQVHSIVADDDGNTFVAGVFMETMHMGLSDSLTNIGGAGNAFDVNAFLIKINSNGFLEWSRNLEQTHAGLTAIPDIRIDANNNLWYTYSQSQVGYVQQVDADGNDTGTPRVIAGVRGISSFDFDPLNNMFITGAASFGQVSMPPVTVSLPNQYHIYVARFDNQGLGTWINFAHDVTFQSPVVKTDNFGNAFIGGDLFDTITWGSFHLIEPQWVNDFWLIKVDGSGVVHWAKQAPQAPTIQGDMARASSRFIDTDAHGHVYMLSTVRGVNDLGNGVVIDAGVPSQSSIAVVRFNGTTGNAEWALKGGGQTFNRAHEIAVSPSNDIYFTQTVNNTSNYDTLHFPLSGNHFVLGKISEADISTSSSTKAPLYTASLYPIPASSYVDIPEQLRGKGGVVTDVTGRVMMRIDQLNSRLEVSTWHSGIYVLKIVNAGKVQTVGRIIRL